MKSIKVLALIVGAIALFPAASFADNVSGSSQEANLESTTIGHGNVNVTDTKQSIIDLQKAGHYGTNVSGTAQKVNASTTTVGTGNVDVKKAVQEALNGQKTK
jgi:opacity protein-like surface antigen